MATERRARAGRSRPFKRTPIHLTSRAAVLKAMREYDQRGSAAFLKKYGFRNARKFWVYHDRKPYDSKAIVGVAFGHEHPRSGRLRYDDFAGGAPVRKALERLGFSFTQKRRPPKTAAPTQGFEEPPPPPSGRKKAQRSRAFAPRQIDHAKRDAANRDLGRSGEEWVMKFEQDRLRGAGRPDLAKRVRWVADEDGDGAGYDIASFKEDGRPLHVEVKATRGGPKRAFILSAPERAFAEAHPQSFALYRVHGMNRNPKVFVLRSTFIGRYSMTPTAYLVRMG